VATKWTNNQKQAIYKDKTNIIVSAGAGSGKTAVLTERIKEKLMAGVNINQLLVLTFTNAAAHEMKERVKSKVLKEPSIMHLSQDIDSAYITTFDSYALSLVKKYSYILNIDKNLSIVENSVINIEKRRIIDEIMEDRYINQPNDFVKLASTFFIKDDKKFKNAILNISNKLDLRYDKEEYLSKYIEEYFIKKSHIKNNINDFESYVLELVDDLCFVLENDIYPLLDEKLANKASEVYEELFNISSYDEVVSYFDSNKSHPRFGNLKDPDLNESLDRMKKYYYEPIKKICCKYPSLKDVEYAILSTETYINAIVSILLDLDKQINEFKFKYNLFEFSDIAKLALKILIENDDIREELKSSLNEILVDEYQDTSDLQEMFVSLIANNNVYMVGDIKQSIYRFRNANPSIFKNKYDNYYGDYSTYDSLAKDKRIGLKIDLTDNFRSRNEVVSTINHIFNQIMSDEVGGANYQKEHKMIYGNKNYDSLKGNYPYKSEILTYEYDNESDIDKVELEIRLMANDIVTKINDGFLIYDKDKEIMRPLEFKDIAILTSSSENYLKIKSIFNEYNIESVIHKNEKINSNVLVFLLKNILTLAIKLYNKEYDIDFNYAFTSIARSFVFEYSDERIFEITTKKTYLEDYIVTSLEEIIKDLPFISLSILMNRILEKYNFYEKLTKIENLEMNLTRTEYFLSLCDKLEEIHLPLNEWPDYFDVLFKDEKGPEITASMKETNAVIIMTIHKSKGLEFPIVYLPFLSKRFNKEDLKEDYLYDKKYGIISPYFNEGIDQTIFKELLKRDFVKEEISERIRLFYVALTRAREKLVFVHQNREKSIKILPTKINSFDDLLSMIEDSLSSYKIKVDVSSIMNVNKLSTTKTIKKVVNTDYVVKDVSIISQEVEKSRASKSVGGLINISTFNNMQMGLHIHELLEYIDYDNPEAILKDEDEWIKKKIFNFLNLFIFENKQQNNYYREYAFTFKDDDKIYNGIIDLIVETPNSIYIIDYKMKHVDDPEYVTQLSIYHKFLSTKYNKPIDVYLYSVIDEKLTKIEINQTV